MSTILDALRKVQRERETRDLRDSVLQDEPGAPRGGGRGWLLPVVAVLALVGAGAGAWFVWPGGDTLVAALPFVGDEPESDSRVASAADEARAAAARRAERARQLREQRQQQARAAQRQAQERPGAASETATRDDPRPPRPATSTPPTRAPSARAAVPAPAPAAPAPRATAQTAKAEPAAREPATKTPEPAPAAAAARRESPAAQPKAAAEAPPFVNRPAPPARASAPAAPARPAGRQVARAETSRPAVDTKLRLEPLPRRRSSEAAATAVVAEDEPTRFPPLSLGAVRWHPEPDRRQARILLDRTRPVDAREGDIVAGVSVEKIEPGAVELRLGETRRRLSLGE